MHACMYMAMCMHALCKNTVAQEKFTVGNFYGNKFHIHM